MLMRKASIDIGSQSILLLIAEVGELGGILPLREEFFAPRLGEGVVRSGRLGDDAMERAKADLARAIAICDEEGVRRQDICAAATAAVREAVNGGEFVARLRESPGLDVRVLSSVEEAETAYRGAVGGLKPVEDERLALLDVGGGSSECVIGVGACPCEAMSVPIGAVKLAERYGRSPGLNQEAVKEVLSVLSGPCTAARGHNLVGVGGTITTLAAVKLGLAEYDGEAVSRTVITLDELSDMIAGFRKITLEQLGKLRGMEPSRADIIEAGATIFQVFMRQAGIGAVRVSSRGLRYGLLEGQQPCDERD
jgi:exopolyphosphatase/guanosine-5'-triphosphate,3'-diphosphate pyrophosphatase